MFRTAHASASSRDVVELNIGATKDTVVAALIDRSRRVALELQLYALAVALDPPGAAGAIDGDLRVRRTVIRTNTLRLRNADFQGLPVTVGLNVHLVEKIVNDAI